MALPTGLARNDLGQALVEPVSAVGRSWFEIVKLPHDAWDGVSAMWTER